MEIFGCEPRRSPGRSLPRRKSSSFWSTRDPAHRRPPRVRGEGVRSQVRPSLGEISRCRTDGACTFSGSTRPPCAFCFVTFGWLLPLAFLGVVAAFGPSREVRLLVGYVAVYGLSLVAFYVHSVTRIFLVPPLAILAAFGLRWLWDHGRRRAWRQALPALSRLAASRCFPSWGFRPSPASSPVASCRTTVIWLRLRRRGGLPPGGGAPARRTAAKSAGGVLLCGLGSL